MALPKCIKTGSEEDRAYRDAQMEIIELQMKLLWLNMDPHITPMHASMTSSFHHAYPKYVENRKTDFSRRLTVLGDIPCEGRSIQDFRQSVGVKIREVVARIKELTTIMDIIVETQEAKMVQEKARLEDVFNLFNGVSK